MGGQPAVSLFEVATNAGWPIASAVPTGHRTNADGPLTRLDELASELLVEMHLAAGTAFGPSRVPSEGWRALGRWAAGWRGSTRILRTWLYASSQNGKPLCLSA